MRKKMNNLSMLRSYIRLIIESIPSGGHGVMTTAQMGGGLQAHPEDTQFSYEDTDGVDIDIDSYEEVRSVAMEMEEDLVINPEA